MNRLYVFSMHVTPPVPVGIFELNDGAGRFAYARSWLARPDAFPLDPVHLPLTKQEFTAATRDGLFNVLRDAGPESWGLRVMEKIYGRQPALVERLLHARAYGSGCLLFSENLDIKPPPEIPDTETLAQAQQGVDQLLADRSVAKHLLQLLESGSALGGARPKTVLRYRNGYWMAKFSRKDDGFDETRAEYALLNLAQRAGIRVPAHELSELPDGRAVLMVERFDWTASGRSHYLSAHALLGYERVREQDTYGDYSYAGISRYLRKYGRGETFEADVVELYRRMTLNVLAHNTDDHLKNHGFIGDRAGLRLAPAFDLTPRPGTAPLHAIGIGRQGRDGTLDNVRSAAGRLGLKRALADEVIDDVFAVMEGWEQEMERAGMNERDIGLLRLCFTKYPFAEPA
ncbi:MAG TPA: type II toxin-antitoxin system HipA family toxin [Gammaproteobacteria bacterium]